MNLSKLAKFALPAFAIVAALALALPGCSPQESSEKSAAKPTDTQPAKPAQPYDAVAADGKGFTVGAMMSAHTVYVLFDPQCPHCGHLWEASVPLHSKVKFVWIPVAFINAKSGPQGAALLAAANPAELMATHEKSILAGTGGISAMDAAPVEINKAIKKNTVLLNSLGVESVPYIIAKNIQTGAVVTNTGAMDTAALGAFLGVN
jgi:thiol:disulfide interchange protein DsbG